MIPLGARPPHRRILAAALAAAAAATIALTSGYPGSGGWLRSKAPAAVNGAEAATASAPVPAPAPARRKSNAPAPAMSSTLSVGSYAGAYHGAALPGRWSHARGTTRQMRRCHAPELP